MPNLTWLLQSAQVSYTPGFTPLATAYHFRFAFGMVERAQLSDQFGMVAGVEHAGAVSY